MSCIHHAHHVSDLTTADYSYRRDEFGDVILLDKEDLQQHSWMPDPPRNRHERRKMEKKIRLLQKQER